MPLQATSGAASYDAFGGGVPFEPIYIEQVFQNWLYTGNGSTQTINNGIDLSGKGGLVWVKGRSNTTDNLFFDTQRGSNALISNATNAQTALAGGGLTSYNSNGFTLGSGAAYNQTSWTYTSWTFREQPKFFDVVTWSGNSVSGRLISHNLNSAPGCIIIKSTNLAGTNWAVWHRSLATGFALQLQGTNAAFSTKPQWFNSSTQGSSTTFEVGNDTDTNETGNTYVAYLFAHNAGGFGLTGTDNVISCGSYVGNSASGGQFINLGYEPQWVLQKCVNSAGTDWHIQDVMRGAPVPSATGRVLRPNSSIAEYDGTNAYPAATGFFATGDDNNSGDTYIYIAIRRGPMKTPTSGTSVFDPDFNASFPQPGVVTTGFVTDWDIYKRTGGSSTIGGTRLTGGNYLFLNDTSAETSGSSFLWDNNTGLTVQSLAGSGNATINWAFRRAPGFFDEVCYTGTGNGTVVSHNLTVEPELAIFKCRNNANLDWVVRAPGTGADRYVLLNTTGAQATASGWYSATSSQITFPTQYSGTASSGFTYVGYLFASCPGVSKVGSYTGNGSSQTINMGFTGGARFFLVKRTDSTGDWWVYDSARGIVANSDPALRLNSTAAEVTSADAVDTDSTGLIVNQESTCNINVNGATYIYLGIS